MSKLWDAKRKYNDIPIPEELSKRVQDAVNCAEARRVENEKRARMQRRRRMVQSVAAAAAVMLTFTTALNTSTAFAESVSQLPVLGGIARVLTFNSYEEETDDWKVSVEIPSVEMIAKDTNGLADSINQEIRNLCEAYAKEAIKRAEEYRQAFLETGGTQEEWEAHNISIKVWYEIKSQTEEYLSFVVRGSESWTSAYNESKYYNIDLKTGKLVTLKDVLGEAYIETANKSIQEQMKTRTLENGMTFWTLEEGGFQSITDETKFYINEAGNPVVVFGKYEIAPGAAGEIEFEIPVKGNGEEETPVEFAAEESGEVEDFSEGYQDNFAVESSVVSTFAEEIKSAVSAQNLEALANLASYPLYVGFADGGVSVTSKEEFLNLGPDRIFTAEMLDSIAAADTAGLVPSMAGFSLTRDGRPNVIFGVVDGRLAVQGMNY